MQAEAIANHILDVASETATALTQMQVIKLAYIAHGWNLALKEKPLFDDPVQAWDHGPVIPDLYHAFKSFKKKPVTSKAKIFDIVDGKLQLTEPSINDLDDNERAFVDQLIRKILSSYGHLTAWQLRDITHMPGTPWHTITQQYEAEIPKKLQIPNELIMKHYKDQLAANLKAS